MFPKLKDQPAQLSRVRLYSFFPYDFDFQKVT